MLPQAKILPCDVMMQLRKRDAYWQAALED
jgi:hypothetical protein